MTSVITKTNSVSKGKSAKTSNGTKLDLNVTSEADIKGVVKGFQTAMASTQTANSTARKELSVKQRDALYDDLAAAAAMAELLLDPANTDHFVGLCEEHNIPQVLDRTKRNVFVAVARLLWGDWTKAKGDELSVFKYSRQPELYGKVLRGAVVRGIKPSELAAKLKAEKGFKKFKEADDQRYLKTDDDVQQAEKNMKDVLNDFPIVSLPVCARLGLTSDEVKQRTNVLLLGRVDHHGTGVDILHRIPVSANSLETLTRKLVNDKLISEIALRKKDAEIAELKRKIQVNSCDGTATVVQKAQSSGNRTAKAA